MFSCVPSLRCAVSVIVSRLDICAAIFLFLSAVLLCWHAAQHDISVDLEVVSGSWIMTGYKRQPAPLLPVGQSRVDTEVISGDVLQS